MGKKSIIVRILDIGIIILSIFFVISLLYAVHSVWEENKYSSYVYEADTFQYRLEDEDYQSMVEMYYSNQATGKANSKKYAEYYAVARYYEAAAMYKAYSEDGDSERAGKAYAAMEEAAAELGDFSFQADRIKSILYWKKM